MASISRAMCPFARPPMAGLHDIWPMVSKFWVNIRVRHPMRLAANAASIPAWPLPITITSYSFGSLNIWYLLYKSTIKLLTLMECRVSHGLADGLFGYRKSPVRETFVLLDMRCGPKWEY